MHDLISTQFWGLYATGELKPVRQFCELGKSLELLASSATEQVSSIPDCSACEIWFSALIPVQEFIKNFPELLPAEFENELQHIFDMGNGLGEFAFRCWDKNIFFSPEWEPIREKANKILLMMNWESLKPHVDDLLKECRYAI